jgi:hypothetical protein
MKISDLKTGDRIRVRYYPGHAGVVGTVMLVIPHASRASGTRIRLDSGQSIRIKASMKIELLEESPS